MRSLRVAVARGHLAIGWPGWSGLALLVLGVLGASLAVQRQAALSVEERAVHAASVEPGRSDSPAAAATDRPALAVLPAPSEAPLLLTQLHHLALRHGLVWPRVDYRSHGVSEGAPAHLQLALTLNGSYLELRGFLTSALAEVPGLAVREFRISRTTIDTPTAEAKLVLVMYMAEGAPQGASVASTGQAGASP